MELESSSPKHGVLDCDSDPDEKEVSDDDDDDRNHKHRRRDARSQSLERDAPEPVFTRPFKKRNKPFTNGNNFRENDNQANANWKNYTPNHLEKDFPGKFDKRRPGYAPTNRSFLDLNQRFRPNHPFPGEPSFVMGRGWSPLDPRFSSDHVPPSLFAGRGLQNVSSAQNAPWNAFGLIPGMPNGNLDAIHSIGLQGTLRPPIPSALSMGIPRQRCRDFEERGFCLRGDMCPMEHGVNRIVIEDVQSLSQFNLPVSFPNVHMIGPTSGPGPGNLASITSTSVIPVNNKGLHNKTNRPGFSDDGLGLNGSYSGSGTVAGADSYDPDQPLWNNSAPEIDESESLMNGGDAPDNELLVRSLGNTVGPSAWGRMKNSKVGSGVKEKIDPAISSSDYVENDSKEDKIRTHSSFRRGNLAISENAAPKSADNIRNIRKPSQKALRTLFVNGVPLRSNTKENLLSHFQKFGDVIDIYIPVNTEQAFVQFAKREDAEAAFKAPDAVMGNRFIKLWWANRDSIPEDVASNSSNALIPPHSSTRNNPLHAGAPKSSVAHSLDAAAGSPKPVGTNGLQQQKKLEQLKEEVRKKQEMLEQKRNDFKRKLVKLEKQATGSKGELEAEQPTKRPKLEEADVAAPKSPDKPSDKIKPVENVIISPISKTTAPVDFTSTKQQIARPFGPSFSTNRFKLDNRPTTFIVLPPLPSGFADVAAVREHFLPYGEISNVELEDTEACSERNESEVSKDCSARISFSTRRSAEKAFFHGKSWNGHVLKFVWLTSSTPKVDQSGGENSPSACKDASVKPEETPPQEASTQPQEAALSENVEQEKLEEICTDKDTEVTEQNAKSTSENEESTEGGSSA